MDETDGLVKVIGDAKTDRLLGVHILGRPRQRHDRRGDGGDGVRRQRAKTSPASFHAHPTLPEAMKEAALAADKRQIHA